MPKSEVDRFRELIVANWRKAGPVYGDNVMPTIETYKEIRAPGERKEFQDALESLLSDPDKEIRSIAVSVCLGFFVFRNVV